MNCELNPDCQAIEFNHRTGDTGCHLFPHKGEFYTHVNGIATQTCLVKGRLPQHLPLPPTLFDNAQAAIMFGCIGQNEDTCPDQWPNDLQRWISTCAQYLKEPTTEIV